MSFSVSYKPNTSVRSCVELHTGGPVLVPYPSAFRLHACLSQVAVKAGPSPDLLLDLCLLVSEEIYVSTYYGRRLLFRISYNHECDENASTDCKTDLCRFFIFSDSVNNDRKDHSAKQTNTKEQTSTQTNETLKQK